MRSGVFTATESSCIAALYAAFMLLAVYRSADSLRDFRDATFGAVRTTAMVLLVIGSAAAFGWLLALLQAPAQMVAFMKGLSDNPIVIFLLLNLLLLFLGAFMDMSPLIIITTPIFLPVVTAFGMDPIHFGAILILNLGIGLCTPPVGSVLFVGCAVGKARVSDVVRTIWPFYLTCIAVLMLVTYVPGISLFLPGLFK